MCDPVEAIFMVKLLGNCSLAEFDMHSAKVGLTADYFQDPIKPIVSWVMDYRAKHGELPTSDAAVRAWPALPTMVQGIGVPGAGLGPIYDEVVNNAMRVDVLESLQDLHGKLKARESSFDIKDAMALHLQVMNAKYSRYKTEIKDFREYGQDLQQDYLDRRSGLKLGIPAPFLFIQEQLGGWHPAQITSCIAPTGQGKTWFLILSSQAALVGDPFLFHRPADLDPWSADQRARARARVLFVSLEMSPLDISRRMAAVGSSTSFNRLMSQKLTDAEQARYFGYLDSLRADGPNAFCGDNLRIVGPNHAATPDQISAQAEEFGADMVMIDGFYYMDGPGKDRWQKVEHNMRQMRLHTLMSNRHYLLATQLRRNEGTLARSGPDAVAFSQSISHDSNNLIFIVPPKDPGNNTRAVDMKLGKARDGALDCPYRTQWDFYDMRFAQLGPVQEMSGAAQSAY
jgi:replicative DNA helicase